MILEFFPSGPVSTNAFFLQCESTKKAAIIDPAPGSFDSLVKSVEKHEATIDKILLTHSHWDHFGDLAKVQERFPVPTLIHKADAPNILNPGADRLPMFFAIEAGKVDSFLEDGSIVNVGELELKVIHTPGHTPGGVSFYLEKEKTLISGDTLFKGSIGNLSFPGCEPEKMWPSLDRLAQLPPETKVYPGHGDATTIGEESWLPRARQIFGA